MTLDELQQMAEKDQKEKENTSDVTNEIKVTHLKLACLMTSHEELNFYRQQSVQQIIDFQYD